MGLSSFIFSFRVGLWKTHVFWNRVRNGPSWSSRVIDFGTNRKPVSNSLLLYGFISQQEGAPAHTARLAQDPIATNCSEFSGKGKWHQGRRTLTLLIITSRELCWTLQDVSSQVKEHWWTEESLAVNVKPAAAVLNQEGHTEFTKRHRTCVKSGIDV